MNTVLMHIRWIIGDGCSINFWKDRWLSQAIVDFLQIPQSLQRLFQTNVKDFLIDGEWIVPHWLLDRNSVLKEELKQIVIPKFQAEDELIWSGTNSGTLSLKDAYAMIHSANVSLQWPTLIWSRAVPPSKSFLIWRIMHHKVLIDDNLWGRGCYMVSMCSLCGMSYETTDHLSFQCPFTIRIWAWFSSLLDLQLDNSSMMAILSILQRNWKPQTQNIILSGIENSVHAIWTCRNALRFDNKKTSFEAAIKQVFENISLSGAMNINFASVSADEKTILDRFRVPVKGRKPQSIKAVVWKVPSFNWIKLNSDGSAKGYPGPAACGGIFRDKHAASLGCFAMNIGSSSALQAELLSIIVGVGTTFQGSWNFLWLECDSSLAIQAFSNHLVVPWSIRNRQKNMILLTKKMYFVYSHMYREGNVCTNKLAKYGIEIVGLVWWNIIPDFIKEDFFLHRISFPKYRFSLFFDGLGSCPFFVFFVSLF